jgi:naphthalene 1,2-dioxygenase system ferredoxin subunit
MTQAEWKSAVEAEGVERDDLVGVTVHGREIAIYNLSGRFYATDNVCTHEHACLSDGFVIGDVIECPLHQGRFHIPTGRPKGAPVHIALRTYPVKVEQGMVFVQIDDSDAPAESGGPCTAPRPAR